MGFESRLAQAFATKSVYWEVDWRGSPMLSLELHLDLLQRQHHQPRVTFAKSYDDPNHKLVP